MALYTVEFKDEDAGVTLDVIFRHSGKAAAVVAHAFAITHNEMAYPEDSLEEWALYSQWRVHGPAGILENPRPEGKYPMYSAKSYLTNADTGEVFYQESGN